MRKIPKVCVPASDAPLYDWCIILRSNYRELASPRSYGRYVGTAWLGLKMFGLCGKVASDGSDVWDAKNVTKSDHKGNITHRLDELDS